MQHADAANLSATSPEGYGKRKLDRDVKMMRTIRELSIASSAFVLRLIGVDRNDVPLLGAHLAGSPVSILISRSRLKMPTSLFNPTTKHLEQRNSIIRTSCNPGSTWLRTIMIAGETC